MQAGHVLNNVFKDLANNADGLAGWLMGPATSPDVLRSPPFEWALALVTALRNGVLTDFFALMRQAAHIQACAAHLLFLEVCSFQLERPGICTRTTHVAIAWSKPSRSCVYTDRQGTPNGQRSWAWSKPSRCHGLHKLVYNTTTIVVPH